MSLSGDTTMMMPVAPTGYAGGNGGFGGFGDNGAWWIIILFLFVFCGWGNNGWGGNGGMNGGVGSEVQRGFDHSSVVSKLDGITQGICDSTYALNNAINTGFSNAELSRCNQQAALIQQLNNMAMQAQNCCCETQRAIDGVNYNMATNTCALQNTMNNNTRDIIDNANANSRAILDYLCQDKISTLQAENQSLRLAASQANQNAVQEIPPGCGVRQRPLWCIILTAGGYGRKHCGDFAPHRTSACPGLSGGKPLYGCLWKLLQSLRLLKNCIDLNL